MKRLFVVAITLLITLALGGCTRNNAPNNITTPNVPAESAPAATTPQLRPVNIQIEFATDELMSQYEYFHKLVHREYGVWFLIRLDQSVTNFEYIRLGQRLGPNDEFLFYPDDVLYSADELTPEKPFFVKTFIHVGTLPHYGIAFTDSGNVRKHFWINENMADEGPQFLIREFEVSSE